MSCCGNKRTEYAQTIAGSGKPTIEYTSRKMWDDVYFEYTGATALTVTGSITGKRYRFACKGDVQLIDYRDAGGMRAVPVLKRREENN
jgi:hypothetical protein